MSYAYVKVELDDIDTSDLIDELESRYLGKREIDWLFDLIKQNDGGKLGLFLKHQDRFTPLELEQMFKENEPPIIVSKEQLTLPL